MVILFLSILISNSLAVELSRRSLIQALTATAAYNAFPKALTTSLTAGPIDPTTIAFHRAMWIENELFNPQVLYDFAIRQKTSIGKFVQAELQTPHEPQTRIALAPIKIIDLQNQLSKKILEFNCEIAFKWNLDPTTFAETILRSTNNRRRFPYAHARGYSDLPIDLWIEYSKGLKDISPVLGKEFDSIFIGKNGFHDESQGRLNYWKNVEHIFRLDNELDEDPLLEEKIGKMLELEVSFSKSKNFPPEHLYEEIAALIESNRDIPWTDDFVPRKYEVLDDQILQEFLAQVKDIWPEAYLELQYEYTFIKTIEHDWEVRYGDFNARSIHSLVVFERDLERNQFQIPKDSQIWKAYLEGKKVWGFDPTIPVLDQLEPTATRKDNYFAKALAQLFVKTEQKINLAATDGLKQLGEHLLSHPVEEETICVKALTDSSTTEVPIDLNLNHETSEVEVDTNQIKK